MDLVSTFGWESETTFPNKLGGVIEYLARVRSLLILASIRYYIYKHKNSCGIVNQTIELYPTRQLSELPKKFPGTR